MERIKYISLGPRYSLRLEDLGRFDRLEANCTQCRNRTVINPATLRLSGHTRIIDIEKRLRCTNCGARNGNTLKTGRLKRD